jgi:hypothetical protein
MPRFVKHLFGYAALVAIWGLLILSQSDPVFNPTTPDTYLNAATIGILFYGVGYLIIGYFRIPQHLWSLLTSQADHVRFSQQGKLLREAQQLHIEGLLSDAEYQERLAKIKRQ